MARRTSTLVIKSSGGPDRTAPHGAAFQILRTITFPYDEEKELLYALMNLEDQ